jgi:hypothetical protein
LNRGDLKRGSGEDRNDMKLEVIRREEVSKGEERRGEVRRRKEQVRR